MVCSVCARQACARFVWRVECVCVCAGVCVEVACCCLVSCSGSVCPVSHCVREGSSCCVVKIEPLSLRFICVCLRCCGVFSLSSLIGILTEIVKHCAFHGTGIGKREHNRESTTAQPRHDRNTRKPSNLHSPMDRPEGAESRLKSLDSAIWEDKPSAHSSSDRPKGVESCFKNVRQRYQGAIKTNQNVGRWRDCGGNQRTAER